ncbi:MAG: hypothetical protein C4527_01315 [Candidatus Omnitrophota bacterium]|nr:MAG: hypothetical protein C4527_01315 [Candidatus Omnitrophota bacterium]
MASPCLRINHEQSFTIYRIITTKTMNLCIAHITQALSMGLMGERNQRSAKTTKGKIALDCGSEREPMQVCKHE